MAGGFVTENEVHRTKHPSIDTNDSSTSSLYSTESQKTRTGPPSGTYHIQLPKDQIYRVPPPENAHRYKHLSSQKPSRSTFRRCFSSFLAALLVVLLLVGILFLVYQPHKPRFSVSGVSIAGINLTSSSPISPVIKIKVRSKNRNGKLGLLYVKGIAAELFYDRIKLGNGEFTAFKQPAKNVRVMTTALRGSSIQLTKTSRAELTESQKKRKVPFGLRFKAPLKFKVGSVTTWAVTVTVNCELTVDKLTASASVMTENCDTGLSLF